ncbi:hypothetical protein [Fictibacillus barbaricus]|uniref:2-acyl-glycerophospho-ethanolamine acyltransferase n=1 Tax=Fictibacillus barbaricus TaxID=182136 RepID=A0ABU1TW11_9BACL|nr:hypothetical protein [Fictibacillus barbaricus]MDR7071399.1 hypothetical protein [Fictibacillus barbaricus]
MKSFFQNPSKVSLTCMIATVAVALSLILLFEFGSSHSELVKMFAKIYIAAALPFLIITPLIGFIYSFFIKGNWKYLYLILNLAAICTISLFALTSFMFRYFVSFGP